MNEVILEMTKNTLYVFVIWDFLLNKSKIDLNAYKENVSVDVLGTEDNKAQNFLSKLITGEEMWIMSGTEYYVSDIPPLTPVVIVPSSSLDLMSSVLDINEYKNDK